MTNRYILGESDAETARLRSQALSHPDHRATWAGVRSGMRVADAGCGPGDTSRALARLVGENGSVEAFDLSEVRIAAAQELPPEPGAAPIHFQVGDISNPPLPERSFDFVYCQFVLEYLPKPQLVVSALARLLRPGGILCLVDIDSLGSVNWPESDVVAQGRKRMFDAIAATGFDPLVGRKLFRFALDAGLTQVDAQVEPFVQAGTASAEEMSNWTQRFAAVAPLGEHAFGDMKQYTAFTTAFLAMMADPGAFKLSNVVTVRGVLDADGSR